MDQIMKIKTANVLRHTARYTMLVLGVMVLLFALVSGSEAYGGGWSGILQNSPNALPWVLLLGLIIVAWKWELVGGVLLTLAGLGAVYFFNFSGPNFWIATFLMTCSIVLLGVFFMGSWFLRRTRV